MSIEPLPDDELIYLPRGAARLDAPQQAGAAHYSDGRTTMDDSGPAFPSSYVGVDAPYEGIGGGMSLRDWFAGMAMHGILAGPIAAGNICGGERWGAAWIALMAVEIADAMLAERAKHE